MPTLSNSRLLHGVLSAALLSAALLGAGSRAGAQYTPPPPPLTPGPCVPTKKDPCPPVQTPPPAPAEKFPFPGETTQSLPGAPGDTTNAPPVSPTVPSPAVPGQASGDGGQGGAKPAPGSFPFPGEPTAAGAGGDSGTSPAGSSSSSSSSPSSSSSSSSSSSDDESGGTGLRDRGSSAGRASGRRILPKVEDLAHRESEDLEVSRYYASVGNHVAAYMRARDAVRVVPGDSAAHFALAEAAVGMQKKEEAVAEYRACLQLAPQGDYAEKARRALANLNAR